MKRELLSIALMIT